MVKNVLLVAGAVALALVFAACNAPKPDYTDVKTAIAQEVTDITAFAAAVDAAADAAAQAAAVTTFVTAYKADIDAFKAALAKHPEANGAEVPADLQDSFKALTDANAASGAALTKISTGAFAADPAVVAALQQVTDLQAELAK